MGLEEKNKRLKSNCKITKCPYYTSITVNGLDSGLALTYCTCHSYCTAFSFAVITSYSVSALNKVLDCLQAVCFFLPARVCGSLGLLFYHNPVFTNISSLKNEMITQRHDLN